jgi:hypothetical protein
MPRSLAARSRFQFEPSNAHSNCSPVGAAARDDLD